jgi:iron(III) transport system substrate-binding protein
MNADRKELFLNLRSSAFICGFNFLFLLCICGCDRKPAREVVLYTSIDQPIAAPIVRDFEKQTGIHVTLVTDTEATKSVGLAERLRAEKANPQADVWWSNEIFHTINLADEGVLTAYASPAAADIPSQHKDPDHRWAGNALRVRVIAMNTFADRSKARGPILSVMDLIRPAADLRGRVVMARPAAGTTGGHVAALYALWGDDKADSFFHALHANGVKLVGGNSVVAELVGHGQAEAGLTDNDDVSAALAERGELTAVLPDQDSFGTLVIPTTVGLMTGAKRPDEAKQLIDYLLSKQVEQKLIDVKFAYGSVREGVGPSVKAMDVDYRAVAKKMPDAVRRATAILEGRE